jgi:osmotically-inducible protein OsmY
MYPTIEQTDSQDLCQRIVSFLIGRGVVRIERLQLTAEGGVLTVGGSLPSDHDRQLCMDCCRHTAGVVRVVDRTRIAKVHRKRLPPRHSAPSPSRKTLMYLSN